MVSLFQKQWAANDVNKAREHGRHIRIHEGANSGSCQRVEELQEEVTSRSSAGVTRPGAQSSRAEAMLTVNALETWGCGCGHVDVVRMLQVYCLQQRM